MTHPSLHATEIGSQTPSIEAYVDERTSLLARPNSDFEPREGEPREDENFIDNQCNVLSHERLLVVFPALALVQFISFLDQTAISTAIPGIAAALQTGSLTSWIGASFLVTSTSIQLINGRLSDIFGRKACLIIALSVMAFGNLASGFAQHPLFMFASRAVSGFGAGALNALIQITVSDLTSLELRGYYFGLIGIATALGNGLGPLLGGLLAENFGWRWSFWFIVPLALIAIIYLVLVLPPPRDVRGDRGMKVIVVKLRQVDWLGVFTSATAVIAILISLSQSSHMNTTSPWFYGPLILGIVLFLFFLIIEWRYVRLPILPFRLFQYNYSTNVLLAMNLIIGWVMMGNLFYVSLYFQNIRGTSPSDAGVLILPITIAHGITSGVTGVLVAALGRYAGIIRTGAGLWTIGAGLKAALYTGNSSTWMFIGFGILEGLGVGCSLQPVLVGLLAGSQNSDRAVMTGCRNFIRDIGGALGLTASNAILNSILQSGLEGSFSPEFISQLTSSASSLDKLDLSKAEKALIREVYMRGLRAVFASYAVLTIVYFICTLLLKDYGLKRNKKAR